MTASHGHAHTLTGRLVASLSYEAYAPLAVKTLVAIARDAIAAYAPSQLLRVVVRHRLGTVPVGGTSVVVAASSVHRHEAMHAVAEVMDRLKAEAAIWKRECYVDGGATWKENGAQCCAATAPARRVSAGMSVAACKSGTFSTRM